MSIDSIVFQALDWKDFNESIDDDDDNNELNDRYIIKLFGRTFDDKSVYVKILDYTPHFYIELPLQWTNRKTEILVDDLKNKNGFYRNSLISYDEVSRYKFRGFNDNKQFKFLRLIFNNSIGMHRFARTLNNKVYISGRPYKFDIYESNIDSFLRCIHIRDLNTCGWIEIKKYTKCIDATTCDINIECDWRNLYSYKDQNIGGAPFKICSFDIECTSNDRSFPQAHRITDKIIQIGSVFSRYGGDIYRRHIITLGSCDPIDGCEVVSVETEKDLLLEWTNLIRQEDPDILTGYNIWGFDETYMYNRSKHAEINCEERFLKLSKLKNYKCNFIEKQLSSAALGDNFLRYFDTCGRLQIDLMKIVQRDHKLSSYKLDSVSENFIQDKIINYKIISDHQLEIESKNLYFLKVGNYIKLVNQLELEYGLKEEINPEDEDYVDITEKYRIIQIDGNKMIVENNEVKLSENGLKELGKELKWGLVKDDLEAFKMFELQKGSSADRKIIAEYCIQDCVLVSRLLSKLEVITNSISMANVCHVPFYYLLIRGQGIKSLSLVSKKCKKENYLIPVLNKDEHPEGSYEGATVFEPKLGFYQTYIPVLDYNSLYPSSIISRNVSHETIVIESQYDNLPDYNYYDVSYKNEDGSFTKCRYAKHKDHFGIIPEILQELLNERKATRKLMEKETDPFKRSILDGKQLALKVTANSLYGQLGASTSPICMKELAASTTAIGREMLELARDFVEKDFVLILKQYYEASINQNTDKINELNEIYLKDNSPENVEFIRFALGEIFNKYDIDPHIIYGDSCTGDTPIILNKIENNDETIIFQTFNGFINNEWTDYNEFKNINSYFQAFKNKLIDNSWIKPSGNLTNKQQIDMTTKNIRIWTHKGWAKINRIIRHKTDKKIYRVLTYNGCIDVTDDHSLLDINVNEIKPENCKIGQELLHSFPYFSNKSYLDIDESYKDFNNKLEAQNYYYLLKTNDYNVSIDIVDEKYRLYFTKTKPLYINNTIKNIFLIHEKYEDYVYDIETEYGVFHAGIGSLIIKNTDSVFCDMRIKFKENDKLLTTKDGLINGIKLGQLASIFIKKRLPFPHNLEYEKTFYPFCIMSKKRYVGNKYEENPNKFKQTSMGIVLKRRDNANIVKKVIGGLINIMMNENDIDKAIKYIKTSIENLLEGKYPITDFITTKTLRATYKGLKLTTDKNNKEGENGTWFWDDVDCSQAHVKLCQRMKKRDPGNAPEVNERIPSVAIFKEKKKGEKMLQGDMIEHPDYIKENNLRVDYLFYLTNQIMNPAIQFLDHLMKKPCDLFNDYINKEELKRKGGISITNWLSYTNDDSLDKYMENINKKVINIVPEKNDVKKRKKRSKVILQQKQEKLIKELFI